MTAREDAHARYHELKARLRIWELRSRATFDQQEAALLENRKRLDRAHAGEGTTAQELDLIERTIGEGRRQMNRELDEIARVDSALIRAIDDLETFGDMTPSMAEERMALRHRLAD